MCKAQEPDIIEGHVETEQERIARLKTWLLERVLREGFTPRVDVVVTNQDKTLGQLIAEARLRGIDTSAYARLIRYCHVKS